MKAARRLRVGGLASVLLFAIALGASSASAAEPPVYRFSFGPDGTETSSFGEIAGVAADEGSGFVYVMDQKTIDPQDDALEKFDLNGQQVPFEGSGADISGNEITGLSFGGSEFHQVAADPASHRIYLTGNEGHAVLAFEANGEPALFSEGPGAGTNELALGSPSDIATGVALDGGGNIYVSDFSQETVEVFAGSGEPITQFHVAAPTQLAVDPQGVVYVGEIERGESVGGEVKKFVPSEPVSVGTTYEENSVAVDAEEAGGLAVDPTTNDIYVGHGFFAPPADHNVAWYDESGTRQATFAGQGEEGELPVGARGVAVHGSSRRIFVGNNQSARVEVFERIPIFVGPPTVLATSVSDVTADSATLHAQIDPNTFATTYRFEYGLADCAANPCQSVPFGGAAIGSGHEPVAVAQHIAGLQPNATYHFRVVAENQEGDNLAEETDHTFTTQGSGLGFRLADGRAWEMVSPPDKLGGRLLGSTLGQIQAAADGNSLAYLSKGSLESDPEGSRIFEAASNLARRGPNGAWSSKDISPPHTRAVGLGAGKGSEYKLFTPDLSRALFQQSDDAPLSPASSERSPYLRQNSEPPVYTPLLTNKEGFANVPAGTQFGGEVASFISPVAVAGSNAALNTIVLASNVPLTEEPVIGGAGALYEWSAGAIQPLSVLPASEGRQLVHETYIGSGAGSVRNAISEDGSRIFWGDAGGNPPASLKALYLRDTERQESVRLDVVQSGLGEGSPNPVFQMATPDGEVVLFTDTQQLTEGASPSGADLYRCVLPAGSVASGCASLTDLSSPRAGSGESAEVQGIVAAMSEEGDEAYFVARGVLDEAANGEGESAAPAQPNLYVWRQGEGVRYIATLAKEDRPAWGANRTTSEGNGNFPAGSGEASGLSAIASPDGRYLAFMSRRSLTGADNHDAQTGEPVQEAFRYDAVTDRLQCVSCNPTGASPHGGESEQIHGGESEQVNIAPPLIDPQSRWEGERLAATLPEAPVAFLDGPSFYRPRSVFNSGRIFFNSFDALVPADSNGQWDVYEYEDDGVGDCSPASAGAATARLGGGCVSLISSGTGETEAAFLDASASGDDAFFLTPARLSVTDNDSILDAYDARVDGTPAVLEPVSECAGETCQAISAPPNDPTPASEAFHGPGNVKPARHCKWSRHKGAHHGRARCGSGKHHKHKRRHRSHDKHRTGANRGAGR